MRLKSGVRVLGIKPEVLFIIHAADPIWQSYGLPSGVTVSGGVEGVHVRASEHYTGLALDLRVHDLPPGKGLEAFVFLGGALGVDFDLFHEKIGTPAEHFHCHYNPKTPMNI